jgi:uncharacterized membrane protein YfcA
MAGLELYELLFMAGVVGIGSFVRGVTGFGSSMIYAVGLTFVLPASEVVPIILLLELVTTVWMLPKVWRLAAWRSLSLLLIGCTIAIPLGLYLLNHVPRAPMQAVIALVVLTVCLILRSGFRLEKQPGTLGTIGVGLISGVLTGATSAGGPPAVIYYFSGPGAVAVGRASLIAFLGIADLIATGMATYDSLIFSETFVRAALGIPPMLVATWIGSRVFHRLDPERFRRWVIVVLACLSGAGLIKATFAMVG